MKRHNGFCKNLSDTSESSNKRLHRTSFRLHLLCKERRTKATNKNLLAEAGVRYILWISEINYLNPLKVKMT